MRRTHACSATAALVLALGGFFAGCSAPDQAPSPMLLAAARQSRAGEEAYLTGQAAEAIPALTEAVRLHLGAGDLPGAARALLNLALAQRAAGDVPGAMATAGRLREISAGTGQQAREQNKEDETSASSPWLDALLALDRGDSAAAAGLVANLPGSFGPHSPWTGRVETLRAEIAFVEGHFPEALIHAQAGRKASASVPDQAEEAHALRVAGSAHRSLGQWTDARNDFLGALKIEETLGGGDRMAGDLDQLAAISGHLGDSSAAELYRQRARAISAAR